MLMICVLGYLAISLPFILAVTASAVGVMPVHGVEMPGFAWRHLRVQWAADVALWVDSLLMATCLPFLDKGREVFMKTELTRHAIFRHYVQHKLRLDLLSSLPYDLLALLALAGSADETRVVLATVALRLPRLLRVTRVTLHIHSVASTLPSRLQLSISQARLAYVSAVWVYVWHFFACVWLLVAYAVSSPTMPTWMTRDIDATFGDAAWAHTDVWVSYLRAAYFTITALSTVGYGDVRPANVLETCISMLLVLTAASLFASLIGLISSLVRCEDIQEEHYKTQTDYMKHYMKHHRLPMRLRARISGYYALLWSNPRVSQAATLRALPHYLIRDMRLFIHRDSLLAVPALSELTFFPIKELCLALRPEIFMETDIVLPVGTPASKLYLVDVGKLRVWPGGRPEPTPTAPAAAATANRTPQSGGARLPTSSGATARFDSWPSSDSRTTTGRTTTSSGRATFGHVIGKSELHAHVGDEMLAYASRAAPIITPAAVEALTHSHLFCLNLAAWVTLCGKFPDELGPISRGEIANDSPQDLTGNAAAAHRDSHLAVRPQ